MRIALFRREAGQDAARIICVVEHPGATSMVPPALEWIEAPPGVLGGSHQVVGLTSGEARIEPVGAGVEAAEVQPEALADLRGRSPAEAAAWVEEHVTSAADVKRVLKVVVYLLFRVLRGRP